MANEPVNRPTTQGSDTFAAHIRSAILEEKIDDLRTLEVIEFWVRDDVGNDENDGLTVDTPLKTIQAAVSKLPFIIQHFVIIHIGPHSGAGYAIFTIPQNSLTDQLIFIGDGAGKVGSDGFVVLQGDTASLAGTTNRATKTSGLAVNVFRGKTIEYVDGAAATQRRTIRDNTATDINVALAFSPAPSVGDEYVILEPEIEVVSTGSRNNVVFGRSRSVDGLDVVSTPGVYFVNMKFTGTSVLSFFDSSIYMFGVEAEDTNFLFERCNVWMGVDFLNGTATSPTIPEPLGVLTNTQWAGWGFYCSDLATAFTSAFTGNYSLINGVWVVPRLQFSGESTTVSMEGGNLFGLSGSIATLGVFGSSSVATRAVSSDVVLINAPAGTPAVSIFGGNASVSLANTAITVVDSKLIDAAGGGRVLFNATVTGENPSGFSVDASGGGVVISVGATVLGRAAGTDYTVGGDGVTGDADVNKSFFSSVDDFIAHPAGSVIQRQFA